MFIVIIVILFLLAAIFITYWTINATKKTNPAINNFFTKPACAFLISSSLPAITLFNKSKDPITINTTGVNTFKAL